MCLLLWHGVSESGDLDPMKRSDPHHSDVLGQSQQIRNLFSAQSSKHTNNTEPCRCWSVASTAKPFPAEFG